MPDLNRRFVIGASTAGAALLAASSTMAQGTQQTATTGAGALNLPDPAQRKGEVFETGSTRIFYTKTGQGSPMLLVHGYPLSGALFGRVVDQLSQNHTVILPDLRGYGQSHAPAITDGVGVYADDVLALMDKLGIQKATIGGMSMGGPTVLSMFSKAPDRFDGLVLIDTIAKAASPAEAQLWRGVETMAEKNGSEDITPFLLPQMLTGKTRMNEKAQAEYLSAIIKPASKTALVSGEAPRVSRRLRHMSRSIRNEQDNEQVSRRGARARGADGGRAPGGSRFGMGDDHLDRGEDRVHGGDAAALVPRRCGTACGAGRAGRR